MKKIKVEYAIIDVQGRGRTELANQVAGTKRGIPFTMKGYLTSINSRDDGVSIELSADVQHFELA